MHIAALHDVIRAALGRKIRHSHELWTGRRIRGVPMSESAVFGRKDSRARNLRLASVIARGVARFEYVYDSDDD